MENDEERLSSFNEIQCKVESEHLKCEYNSKDTSINNVDDMFETEMHDVKDILGSNNMGENVLSQQIYNASKVNVTDVPYLHESDSDNEEPQKKPKITTPKIWKYERTFGSENEVRDFINTELCWSLKNTNHTEQGKIKYYRCNKVKSRGEQCKSGLKLIFDSSCTEVILHRSETNHNCDTIVTKAGVGLSNEIKIAIEDLYRKKFKPKAILEILIENYFNPPSIIQIKKYVAQLKKSIYGPSTINLGELDKWLNLHGKIPSENCKSFVVNYLTNDSNDGSFRFMVSSKTLLKLALKEDLIIHADATYKLIWQGFPVLLLGTTDRNRKFHLLGVAVCSNEEIDDFDFIFRSLKEAVQKIYNFKLTPKVLVADASHSIGNGFKNVFGREAVIRMCWAHMRRAVQKKVQALAQKANVNQILSDIDAMQVSENENAFSIAYKLFVKKWEQEPIFLKYFQEEWYNKNNNWYEGASPGTPSTNNSLESTNRVIKDEYTFRERLPLTRFCYILMEMIESFSKKYENSTQEFSNEVFFDLKTWTSAYQWARLNKKIEAKSNALERIYLIPAGEYSEINKINLVGETEDSFDEYIRKKCCYYNLTLPKDDKNWKDGQCTCPFFLKYYVCKHLLGIAIRFKLIHPPLEAKNLEIGTKRKRGRPPKTKKALIVQ